MHLALIALLDFIVEAEVASRTFCKIVDEEFMDEQVFCICVPNSRPLSRAAKVFFDAVVDVCRRYSR